MSDFVTAMTKFQDHIEAQMEATAGKAKRKWSTSEVSTYGELLDIYNTDTQNSESKEQYTAEKKIGEKADLSRQTALKVQIQMMAGIRRSFRSKMISGPDNVVLSSADVVRQDYFNKHIVLGKIERLKKNKAINLEGS